MWWQYDWEQKGQSVKGGAGGGGFPIAHTTQAQTSRYKRRDRCTHTHTTDAHTAHKQHTAHARTIASGK